MELIRLAGIGMILLSSAGAGLHAALGLRRTHEQLRDLIAAFELISGEIRYFATPFAPLCQRAGAGRCAGVQGFFQELSRQAEQADYSAEEAVRSACAVSGLRLPEPSVNCLRRLFDSFGRLDRESQLRQLELTLTDLKRLSGELNDQLEGRCRTYQMLGLSAGVAVLVLVL